MKSPRISLRIARPDLEFLRGLTGPDFCLSDAVRSLVTKARIAAEKRAAKKAEVRP